MAQRQPYLVLVLLLTGSLGACLFQLSAVINGSLNCCAFFIASSLCTTVVTVLFLVRIVILWYFIQFSNSAAQFVDLKDQFETKTQCTIFGARKFIKRWKIAIILASIVIVLAPLVRYMNAFLTTPGSVFVSMRARACVEVYTKTLGTIFISSIVPVVFLLIIYLKIRKFEDNFHLISECKTLGKWFVGTLSFVIITAGISELSPIVKRNFNLAILAYPIITFGACKVMVLDVVQISRTHTRHMLTDKIRSVRAMSVLTRETMQAALKAVLADEEMTSSLKDFLIKEFSVENVLFLKAVDELRSTSGCGTADCSKNIWTTFCRSDAPLTINIGFKTVKELKSVFESESFADTEEQLKARFDIAYDEIFSLVLTDSFPRFLQHSGLSSKLLFSSTTT
jgi:hypothetical protein